MISITVPFTLKKDYDHIGENKHTDFMIMPIKYRVALSKEEVPLLSQLKNQKNLPKYIFLHIQILLALDASHTHQHPSEVAKSLEQFRLILLKY